MIFFILSKFDIFYNYSYLEQEPPSTSRSFYPKDATPLLCTSTPNLTHVWLPWVCCTLLVVAPTPELLQRPCITQDGAQSAVRTPAPFSTTLRWRANNLQPLVQLWRDMLRSAESQNDGLHGWRSRTIARSAAGSPEIAISGPDMAGTAESPSQGTYSNIPNV